MQERFYYTYIVASRTRVLYVGVTGNLQSRVEQHRNGHSEGFTKRYRCCRLVWFERYANPLTAIAREKELKGWKRNRKIALIEKENPAWVDLSAEWGKSFL